MHTQDVDPFFVLPFAIAQSQNYSFIWKTEMKLDTCWWWWGLMKWFHSTSPLRLCLELVFFFTSQGAQSTWSMLFALAFQLEDGFVRQLLIGIEVVSQLSATRNLSCSNCLIINSVEFKPVIDRQHEDSRSLRIKSQCLFIRWVWPFQHYVISLFAYALVPEYCWRIVNKWNRDLQNGCVKGQEISTTSWERQRDEDVNLVNVTTVCVVYDATT